MKGGRLGVVGIGQFGVRRVEFVDRLREEVFRVAFQYFRVQGLWIISVRQLKLWVRMSLVRKIVLRVDEKGLRIELGEFLYRGVG